MRDGRELPRGEVAVGRPRQVDEVERGVGDAHRALVALEVEEQDLLKTRELLEGLGFGLYFIDSSTLESGGSLHYLTALVHLSSNGAG